MLKSMEEIKKVELPTVGVINGVDNANLLSVDSIEPISKDVDSVSSGEEAGETRSAAEKKEEEEEGSTKTATEKETTNKANVEGKTEAELEAAAEAEAEAKVLADAVKKEPVEKRIGQLTKKWRTAERALSNEQAKRKTAEVELKKLKALVPDKEKPVREDFEEDIDFIEALTDWKVDTKLKAQQVETIQEIDESSEQQTIEDIEQGIEDVSDRGREKHEDYDKLVFDKNLVLTQDMLEVVLMSEIAEEILYYFGSNPDTSAALGEMSALKAAKEIGKIEVELLALIPDPNVSSDGTTELNDPKKVKEKPKKLTKAPAPIIPVKATGVTEKDPNDMPPKEYRAWRESKE